MHICSFAAGAEVCKEKHFPWHTFKPSVCSLIHPFSLSLLPPHGFPNHTTASLTDQPLTDLQPPSFHWPLAWQLRINAGFSLAKAWQVNLWLLRDLMPPAFEVSYCSVAYRTQKRCQVAIVKSYPWREVALEYNSPYIMRASCRGRTVKGVKMPVVDMKMLWIKEYTHAKRKKFVNVNLRLSTPTHSCCDPSWSAGFFGWLWGQTIPNDYVNHFIAKLICKQHTAKDTFYLTPTSAHCSLTVRAMLSSVCSLSLHQPDSLSWQDREDSEYGPAMASTHGNLWGEIA